MLKTLNNLFKRAVAHDGLKKYGANTLWLFAEKLFRMAIGFTVGIYVARQLGPAKYGILNYAISFAAIFSVMVSLGLDQIVVRELVKRPRRRDSLLGTAFLLRLIGFLLMLGGVAIGLTFSNNETNTNMIVLVIAAGYLFQIFQTIDLYFQANVLSKYVAISQTIAWSLVSAGRAFCAWQGYPLIYFAWLEAANMALMSFGYIAFYSLKADLIFKWQFKLYIAKFLIKNSWPLLLSGGAAMIYMRIDQVMIKTMLGVTEVGYYAVAVRLSELWYFVPMIIGSTLLPAIIRSRKVSEIHYMERLQKYYTFMIWTSILLCIGMNLISYHLVIMLYGNEYAPAVIVLIVYMWQLITVCMSTPWVNWLMAENMQIYLIIYSALGAVINVLLNYFLIKRMGINGAALATVIAPLASFITVGCLNKKMRKQLLMVVKGFLLVYLFEMFVFKKQCKSIERQ